MKTRKRVVRILVALGVLVLAVASAHFEGALPVATLCVVCPVGFSQVAVASGTIPWHLLPGMLAVLAIVLLLGRVFCSWVCPTQMLKNIFGGRAPRGILGRSGQAVEKKDSEPSRTCSTCGSTGSLKTQGVVLAVLLVVSFIVKFPVFCLFCPIGLVFGTLWALNRVFVLLQPGWELIIFPLMLIAELFLFKKWCAAICPLGFFFGLMAKARTRLGFGVRPRADCTTCIASEGCRTCSTVCPENIDVSTNNNEVILQDCSLCGDCTENCPTKAIKLTLKQEPSRATEETAKRM
ncbi:MAG: 4Fe-4S binding protein [Gordonibacter sp.]|nr:4Fe-4S binding protein [Gordonibacter sp.]